MKILIVDDDKDYLNTIGYMLQSTGCEADVVYASNPRELNDIRVDHFDVCLSGYSLMEHGKQKDAYSVLKYLTENGFHGRFVIISMEPKHKIFSEMFAHGVQRVEVIEKGRSRSLRRFLEELVQLSSESFA